MAEEKENRTIKFHAKATSNMKISDGRLVAQKIGEAQRGYIFSDRPVENCDSMEMRVLSVKTTVIENPVIKPFTYGITNVDPQGGKFKSAKQICASIERRYCKIGNIISIQINQVNIDGPRLRYFVNGQLMPNYLRLKDKCVDLKEQTWFVIDSPHFLKLKIVDFYEDATERSREYENLILLDEGNPEYLANLKDELDDDSDSDVDVDVDADAELQHREIIWTLDMFEIPVRVLAEDEEVFDLTQLEEDEDSIKQENIGIAGFAIESDDRQLDVESLDARNKTNKSNMKPNITDEEHKIMKDTVNREADVDKCKPAPKSSTCVVCMDKETDTVFKPCGHQSFCWICSSQQIWENCPICRANIRGIVKILKL